MVCQIYLPRKAFSGFYKGWSKCPQNDDFLYRPEALFDKSIRPVFMFWAILYRISDRAIKRQLIDRWFADLRFNIASLKVIDPSVWSNRFKSDTALVVLLL
jgi:hypothetical protein